MITMRRPGLHALGSDLILVLLLTGPAWALDEKEVPPSIRKLGTLDLDMVETTPVVFHDRL